MRHETPNLFGFLINDVSLNCDISDTERRILKWPEDHEYDHK